MSTRDEVATWRREGRCEGCGAYFNHEPDCPGDIRSRLAAAESRVAELEAEAARLKARLEHAWDQGDETAQRRMAAFARQQGARALVGDETTPEATR